MKKQVADRLFQNSIALAVIAGAYCEPDWALHKIVAVNGTPADVCMGALAILSLIAFFDTLVNDMLPDRFSLQVALGKRRGIWMMLAITYAGIAFVSVHSGFGIYSAIYFMLFASRCAGVAFLDLYYEFEQTVKDPASAISSALTKVVGDA